MFQLFSGDSENGVVNLDSCFGMKTQMMVILVKRGFADKAKATFITKEAFCDVNLLME